MCLKNKCVGTLILLMGVLSQTAVRAENTNINIADANRYPDWNAAFAGPVSRNFGIAENRQPKNTQTWYTFGSTGSVGSKVFVPLTFDVSNNGIMAWVQPDGAIKSGRVLTGVRRQFFRGGPGIFAWMELVQAGPWSATVQVEGQPPVATTAPAAVTVDVLNGLFPLCAWKAGPVQAQWLVYAPEDRQLLTNPVRAVIGVLRLTNTGRDAVRGEVEIRGAEGLREIGDAQLPADACEAVVGLDGLAWAPSFPKVAYSLPAGGSTVSSLAFLVGESADELKRTAERVRQRSPLAWLNQSLWRADRMGALTIPDAPLIAELLIPYEELCRNTMFYMRDGRFGGGDQSTIYWVGKKGQRLNQAVWFLDTYYQMLALSFLQPEACRDSIRFFLQYGFCDKPYGYAVNRFPNAPRITHSLCNGLAPFVLAGTYYQMTGDAAFFKALPELLAAAKERFGQMIESRPDKGVWLFPAIYISDGEACGDYHTGSNVMAWKALTCMARLAREAYGDEALATQWSEIASKVKADLFKHCVGDSPDGRRFFEGVNRDGSFVQGHDGEESDVGLMPFYGMTEADEPAMMTHSRLALSDRNPAYVKELDAVEWRERGLLGRGAYATFPGWTSALAGARDETELTTALNRIVNRTDLNGAIYWWPNQKRQNIKAVIRHCSKTGYAAGIYLCRFVHDIVGVQVDVPSRQVALRPFCPWNSFEWKNMRLGSAQFDVRYENAAGKLSATLVNRNAEPYSGVIELTLPPGTRAKECRVDGRKMTESQPTTRYERLSVRIAQPIAAGQALRLDVDYDRK